MAELAYCAWEWHNENNQGHLDTEYVAAHILGKTVSGMLQREL